MSDPLSDDAHRRLLGDFIRAHRERARPVGAAGRRRTPGLRREELAAQAGISATWCAWIEQGRPVQASPDALGRIANALALTLAERAYLFKLAGRIDPDQAPAGDADAPDSLRRIVEALPCPAYGLDRLWNACCWNRAAERLFGGWLDGASDRNLLRFVFLSAGGRALIPDWEERSRRLLAEFRSDFGRSFRDPRVRGFLEALRAESAEFAKAWQEQDVQDRTGGLRTFAHPLDGPLSFSQFTYNPADHPDYKLVALFPLG